MKNNVDLDKLPQWAKDFLSDENDLADTMELFDIDLDSDNYNLKDFKETK